MILSKTIEAHHSQNLNYRLIIDNIFSQLQWKNEVTSPPFEGHLMMNSQYTTMNVQESAGDDRKSKMEGSDISDQPQGLLVTLQLNL